MSPILLARDIYKIHNTTELCNVLSSLNHIPQKLSIAQNRFYLLALDIDKLRNLEQSQLGKKNYSSETQQERSYSSTSYCTTLLLRIKSSQQCIVY